MLQKNQVATQKYLKFETEFLKQEGINNGIVANNKQNNLYVLKTNRRLTEIWQDNHNESNSLEGRKRH